MSGCCYVNSEIACSKMRHRAKCISFGPPIPNQYGETEDVLMDGQKVGFRFFSYT